MGPGLGIDFFLVNELKQIDNIEQSMGLLGYTINNIGKLPVLLLWMVLLKDRKSGTWMLI